MSGQCYSYIETNQLISNASQVNGFYKSKIGFIWF